MDSKRLENSITKLVMAFVILMIGAFLYVVIGFELTILLFIISIEITLCENRYDLLAKEGY